ncbi:MULTISPECIES: hypothetical protein [unclassified Corynebacterium]|uniref:hypothetical protein n=1 Tax=unclassified Corynebacterium TaxID=2624378 RepID=UPI0029C9FE76|nr:MULTISPECIES: hypothetical protein [unclassified Corynebacterium]WPF65502.1 hypothetical protein OLX12_07915 [Corynebacterium sp. 22KM0430]WPF67998.1 hypothetical protein OLW90_07910 [Corynebacterium sp. 21KM1197]
MALQLSLDLHGATLSDLEALVAAARSAGAQGSSAIDVDTHNGVLSVRAQAPRRTPPSAPREEISGVGEAAVRSVIDILTGRQEPPRR